MLELLDDAGLDVNDAFKRVSPALFCGGRLDASGSAKLCAVAVADAGVDKLRGVFPPARPRGEDDAEVARTSIDSGVRAGTVELAAAAVVAPLAR